MRKKPSEKNQIKGHKFKKIENLVNRYFRQVEHRGLDQNESSFREDEIFQKIKSRIDNQDNKKSHNWKIAASLVGFLCFSGLAAWFYFSSINPSADTLVLSAEKATLEPGGNRATLTLADGTTVDLSSHFKGRIANQEGAVISKPSDGMLVYNVSNPQHGRDADYRSAMVYNSITTPSGGQFAVVLPDGSKVWLNAESTLKYPTSFHGDNRTVELEGEGYFEVQRNEDKPFRVKSNDQLITVLGTKFNVNSYQNEPYIRTTLVEGSVQVEKANEKIVLKPGEQALVKEGIEVNNVNSLIYTAWKNGDFIFKNDGIQDIMKQIARWYNIDVEYEGANKKVRFGGIVSRSQNLSTVLTMLEKTGRVKFQLLVDAHKKKQRVKVIII